jgi:hypothetical protein
MATLISVYNSQGLVGRCDAKCYSATDPKCTCICGGANHGAGQQKAIANTERMAETWIEEYTKANHLGKDAVWLVPSVQIQLPL